MTRPSRTGMDAGTVPWTTSTRCSSPSSARTRGSLRARIPSGFTARAITCVRLERRSGDIVLDRPDGKTAALRQPEQPEHRIALPIRQLRECLAEELRRLDPDEVYAETLVNGLPRVAA